jgi:hypothetical protein
MKWIRAAVGGGNCADAAMLVELGDAPLHCTILLIGSSRMPVAP